MNKEVNQIPTITTNAAITIKATTTTTANVTTSIKTQQKVVDARYLHRPDICHGRNLTLIICVPISRANAKGRMVIRETWGACASRSDQGHPANPSQALVFFVGAGKEGEPAEIQSNIDHESEKYSDIIQGNFIDSYRNLTMKSIALVRWAYEFCPQARFLLKADDDMYINIPLLLKLLQNHSKSHKPFVVGSVQVGARPLRDKQSKWYVPFSQYKESYYPKYASGTAYAMSLSAAGELSKVFSKTPYFWLEDIYITGLSMRSTEGRVELISDNHFTYTKPHATGSSFDFYVSGHRYTLEEIRRIHRERGGKCS